MPPTDFQPRDTFAAMDRPASTARRSILSGAAATVAALVAGRASAKPRPGAAATAARNAFDPATFTGPGIESETGNPVVEVAEAQLFNGGMWEGAARLHKDSPTGPVVGRSFCEFMWAPFDSPLGKDIPYDPAITASPGAGLTEARDFRAFTKW